jgi:tartrate dehydratase alpha subunit/fumarate hydratase class I-like protein
MIQEEEVEHVEVEEATKEIPLRRGRKPQIQEEENETTQIQEGVEEVTEEIPLRRSNRIPQTSTKL